MSSESNFSQKFGYHRPLEREITIREDAPFDFRHAVVLLAEQSGLRPSSMRDSICEILLKRPNPDNWSEYPNIKFEVDMLVDESAWYRVYDIAEAFYSDLNSRDPQKAINYQIRLNEYLLEHGIGWIMENGKFAARGSEIFQKSSEEALTVLKTAQCNTAAQEIHEAIKDISRRPADITGAIQHAMAALECIARDVSGDPRKTLGEILKAQNLNLPKPLDIALEKMWGYASETGRHLREGRNPSFDEAELVVSVSSTLCTYLAKKKISNTIPW